MEFLSKKSESTKEIKLLANTSFNQIRMTKNESENWNYTIEKLYVRGFSE